MRLCIIGDELAAGVGDPRALGWLGRAIARSEFSTPPVVMSLVVPGETTKDMTERWESEVTRRYSSDEDTRLVVAVGTADIPTGVSLPRTRLHLATIADQALSRGIPTMFIGPPPLAGVNGAEVEALSQAVQDVATRRGLPFINCCTPLRAHEQWLEDMAHSEALSLHGATLPGQAGYALMAWLVLHQGWYEWTGAGLRE